MVEIAAMDYEMVRDSRVLAPIGRFALLPQKHFTTFISALHCRNTYPNTDHLEHSENA